MIENSILPGLFVTSQPYFQLFEDKKPPKFGPLARKAETLWQLLAGITVGLSLWYLHWRWTMSLNPDAMVFSIFVASAETLFFIGTLLFFHDIWREQDTPKQPPPQNRNDLGFKSTDQQTSVDIFITTFDEEIDVLAPSILAAKSLRTPRNMRSVVWILDDGNRASVARIAADLNVGYLSRDSNIGFKAGNLRNALLQTNGDLIVICDADTRIFPNFLTNTTGYFRDPNVAWVQTPHWFYDIPDGERWSAWIERHFGHFLPKRIANILSNSLVRLSGGFHKGSDPFMSEPALFFDVIQRRRNRNGASFCCGAGSIHRREALFEASLYQLTVDLKKSSRKTCNNLPLAAGSIQPFKFHVSEDIYTSILLHSNTHRRWISVYHPDVECKMLSPWTLDAWATQKLKYAGGTYDIMFRANPLFKWGMPWRTKLHYAATFWSYLSILWMPILLFAPVFSMFTGWSPVKAYSIEFFMHLLPVLIVSELAMVAACKGYNISLGRLLAVGSVPILIRALVQVAQGKRPRFPTTPKTPISNKRSYKLIVPNLVILTLFAGATMFGFYNFLSGVTGYTAPFVVTNIFWIGWNSVGFLRIVKMAMWQPFEHQNNGIKEGRVCETA